MQDLTPIVIDGSEGEGGGQILRTALGLSLVTGRPFRIERIRAGRPKPGLLRQHLTAVQAAAEIGHARVVGAALGASALTFEPGWVEGGEFHFAVGTAGSATLVLQTVLPALLRARSSSRLVLEGGTHNPAAPPFDFLARTFLPLLTRMGPRLEARLERPGFFPAGGGRFSVTIEPASRLTPLDLLERLGSTRLSARALVASLPETIARRELAVLKERLGLADADGSLETVRDSAGPGNAVLLTVASENITELVTGFGQRGVSAEAVAAAVADEAQAYLASGVPVGLHLADQLLVPLALAGGGSFRTLAPTAHTTTNASIVGRFLDVDVRFTPEAGQACRVTVVRRSPDKTPSRA